jgi:hypothetical protein
MPTDTWTWTKCQPKLKTLRNRLGFPDTPNLSFLKLRLSLETGEIHDEIRNKPYPEAKPTAYCILSGYADAEPTTETKQLISFQQVPGGIGYNTAFIRRAVQPIERTFSSHPQRLSASAALFNAEKQNYGDYAVKIHALPLVPITIILHAATTEFPASANMLFDSTVNQYLTTEQIAMLGQLTSLRLAHANEAIT